MGIYQANFNNDGLCHLTPGVSFSIFQKFQTFVEAFQYTQHYEDVSPLPSGM